MPGNGGKGGGDGIGGEGAGAAQVATRCDMSNADACHIDRPEANGFGIFGVYAHTIIYDTQ